MPAIVNATNTGHSTSYVITGDSLEAVNEAIERICRNYHPLGYGTSFQPAQQKPDGSWLVRGRRSNSCD
jgi:hypothetical protein